MAPRVSIIYTETEGMAELVGHNEASKVIGARVVAELARQITDEQWAKLVADQLDWLTKPGRNGEPSQLVAMIRDHMTRLCKERIASELDAEWFNGNVWSGYDADGRPNMEGRPSQMVQSLVRGILPQLVEAMMAKLVQHVGHELISATKR